MTASTTDSSSGRAATRSVDPRSIRFDDDLAPHDLAHTVVVERLDGAIGEGVLVEDLGARVVRHSAGEQQQRGHDHEEHARRAAGAPAGALLARHADAPA